MQHRRVRDDADPASIKPVWKRSAAPHAQLFFGSAGTVAARGRQRAAARSDE